MAENAEQEPQQAEPEPRQRTDWKAESRKWEERAKRREAALRDLKTAGKAGVPADVLARMEGDPEENAAILVSDLAPAREYKVTRDVGEKPAAKADPMREAARTVRNRQPGIEIITKSKV